MAIEDRRRENETMSHLAIHCTYIESKEHLARWRRSVASLPSSPEIRWMFAGHVSPDIARWEDLVRHMPRGAECITFDTNAGKCAYVNAALAHAGPESDHRAVAVVDSDIVFGRESGLLECLNAVGGPVRSALPEWAGMPLGVLCLRQTGDVRQTRNQFSARASVERVPVSFDPRTPTGTGGGVMLVLASLLLRLGGLPSIAEGEPYQQEDLLVCLRARNLGYATAIAFEHRVEHPPEKDAAYRLRKAEALHRLIPATQEEFARAIGPGVTAGSLILL